MTSCDGVRVSVHRRRRRRAAAIAALCLLVAGFLAGCSTNDGVGSFIIDPGNYSVYHCDGLAARLKALLAREQELTNLMDRASEGGGGVLIGNLTYRADYENTVGEEKVLRRTAAEKKCDLPPPAAPASPTPAAYTAPPPGYAAPPPGYTAPAQPPANAPIFQSDQTIR
jgi:predicted small secreted protein